MTNIKLQIANVINCVGYWRLDIGHLKLSKGFTLVELLISMSTFVLLLTVIALNLNTAQHQASIDATRETLITDLNHQQVKAMVGDTEGRTDTSPYGIHFDLTSYTLFHDTYSPSDPTNFVITIPDIFQVTTTFSGSDVIFSKGSGEIQNYNAVADEIVITNVTNGNQTTVELNRYGVVTEVTQ